MPMAHFSFAMSRDVFTAKPKIAYAVVGTSPFVRIALNGLI